MREIPRGCADTERGHRGVALLPSGMPWPSIGATVRPNRGSGQLGPPELRRIRPAWGARSCGMRGQRRPRLVSRAASSRLASQAGPSKERAGAGGLPRRVSRTRGTGGPTRRAGCAGGWSVGAWTTSAHRSMDSSVQLANRIPRPRYVFLLISFISFYLFAVFSHRFLYIFLFFCCFPDPPSPAAPVNVQLRGTWDYIPNKNSFLLSEFDVL